MTPWDVFSHPAIQGGYEVVGEWAIWIDNHEIRIRVKKDKEGYFYHESSHYYKGSSLASTYRTSATRHTSLEESLRTAVFEKTAFYNAQDEGRRWIRDEDY